MELNERSNPYCSSADSKKRDAEDDLAPPDFVDPLIEAFKKDIDRTLLVANLRLSVAERLAKFQDFMNAVGEMRGAALPPEMREKQALLEERKKMERGSSGA
jgi:hypothetical protein